MQEKNNLQDHLLRMRNLLFLEYFFDNVVKGHSITFMGIKKEELYDMSDYGLEQMSFKAIEVSENLRMKVLYNK